MNFRTVVIKEIFKILDRLLKESINHIVCSRAPYLWNWMLNELHFTFPKTEVPILCVSIGNATMDDCALIMEAFCNYREQEQKKNSPDFTESSNERIVRLDSFKCQSLGGMLKSILKELKVDVADVDVIKFLQYMHINYKQCRKIVLVLEDSERIPLDVLSSLLDICHMLRTPNVAYRSTSSTGGFVYVGLILCITISTVESIHSNWSSDRLLKTISTGAKACDINDIINLYLNKVDEDPSLCSSAVAVNPTPSESMWNSLAQDIKSLSLVHKNVQCFFKLRVSYYRHPLFLLPLFVGENKNNNDKSRKEIDLSATLTKIYSNIFEKTLIEDESSNGESMENCLYNKELTVSLLTKRFCNNWCLRLLRLLRRRLFDDSNSKQIENQTVDNLLKTAKEISTFVYKSECCIVEISKCLSNNSELITISKTFKKEFDKDLIPPFKQPRLREHFNKLFDFLQRITKDFITKEKSQDFDKFLNHLCYGIKDNFVGLQVACLVNPSPVGAFEGVLTELTEKLIRDKTTQSKKKASLPESLLASNFLNVINCMYEFYCSFEGDSIDLCRWFFGFCQKQMTRRISFDLNKINNENLNPILKVSGRAAMDMRCRRHSAQLNQEQTISENEIYNRCCIKCLKENFRQGIEAFIIFGLINEPIRKAKKNGTDKLYSDTTNNNMKGDPMTKHQRQKQQQQNLKKSLDAQLEFSQFKRLSEVELFAGAFCKKLIYSDWPNK